MAGAEEPRRGLPKLDELRRADRERPVVHSKSIEYDEKKGRREKKKNPGRPRKEEDQETDIEGGMAENDANDQLEASLNFLDPNKEITKKDLINISKGYTKTGSDKKTAGTTTRATSPLEGMRKGLEDQWTINQILEVLKTTKNGSPSTQAGATAPADNGIDSMINMLSLMGAMGNGDSPMSSQQSAMFNMVLQTMMSQQKGGNSMASIIPLLTTLMKLPMAQGNNNNNNTANEATAAVINELTNQIKEIVNQQQRQPQGLDMNMLLLRQLMQPPAPQNTGNQEILLAIKELVSQNRTNETQVLMQNNQMFQAQQNKIMVEALMSLRDRNVDPKQEFMETARLLNELQGEKRQRTRDDLEFEHKKLELMDKKEERLEKQRLADKEIEREHEKSMAMVGLGDKLLGEGGIGTIIGGVANALRPAKKAPVLGSARESSQITGEDLNLL